ncbi:MAG: hypothetical protein ACN4GR_06865 [Arenicellales bacterium]
MKSSILKKSAFAGIFCALVLPAAAASVDSDVEDFLQDKNPQSIADYPEAFTEVYEKHAPVIKESTLATVVYYFTETDEHSSEDIVQLTNQAVSAAIAISRSDGDEDDLASNITDAVCGTFKGGIHAAYKQVTSAGKAVEGGLQAALDAGVEPDYAATAVTRGIDTCLQQRLDNDVALIVGTTIGGIMGNIGIAYNYIAPYPAYLPPTLGSGDVDLFKRPITDFPGEDRQVCVSNCI